MGCGLWRVDLLNQILNFFFLSYFFAVGSKYYENKSFHSALRLRQDLVEEVTRFARGDSISRFARNFVGGNF